MEKYYEQLNSKCKEVAKEVIKDNSILSDNMLKNEEREFLLSDWNAFLIGLISDQSVNIKVNTKITKKGKINFTNLGNKIFT